MKKNKLYFMLAVFFLAIACSPVAWAETTSDPNNNLGPEQLLYNKFNIHIQYKGASNITASYANWTGPFSGHKIIPPNTAFLVRTSENGISLKNKETGEQITYLFAEKHMAMDKKAYLEKIFSPDPVPLDGLSELDLKGIKNGSALNGMTRKGVMIAMGYPAAHRTPSLDAGEWIYWTNRFGTIAVVFDENGIVTGTRN
ncbi:MAG: hypothetical protein WC836_07110 [Desulfobacula sp.]|jgi:hypothetical protein